MKDVQEMDRYGFFQDQNFIQDYDYNDGKDEMKDDEVTQVDETQVVEETMVQDENSCGVSPVIDLTGRVNDIIQHSGLLSYNTIPEVTQLGGDNYEIYSDLD